MIYFAFAILGLFALSGLSQAKQTYIVINEAAECFSSTTDTVYDCDLKLVGRQRLINGTMSIKEDLDNEHYQLQLELFSSAQGDDQFRRLPMGVPPIGFCEGVRGYYAKLMQPSLTQGETTNLPFVPEDGICPIPKGEYFVKNLEFDTNHLPNEIPRGLLKSVFTVFKEGVNVGGNILYLRVEDDK